MTEFQIKEQNAMKKDGILGAVTPNYATIEGTGVWYAPNTLHVHELSCAGCITMCTTTGGTVDIVMVDDRFMNLSKRSRYFFINHELGHIKNGDLVTLMHPVNQLIYRFSCIYGVSKMEFLADLYASRKTGISTAMSAFRELAKGNTWLAKLQLFKRAIVLRTYYRLHKEALE